ncbi:tetraspanin-15 [Culicoides brevitarsis]|uniref:tetraspanin-15 n=1 Tax=Culicoides brevitarsis TaxID=469753 RepID=UPI00307B3745
MSLTQLLFSDLPFKVLVFLNVVQIVVGFAMLFLEEYIKHLLTQHMLEAERTQTYIIMLLSQVYCMQVIVLYYLGLAIAIKCNRDLYTHHLTFFMKMWLALGFVAAFEGILVAGTLYRTSKNLSEFLELELFKGVEAYYLDPEWRLIWDTVQYHENCCGVFDYRDWKNCWLYKMEHKQKILTSNVSFIPYSCCENEETCYQNIIPILLKDQKINVPAIDTSVINERGCLYGLLHECQWVITMVICSTIVVFLVQIFITVTLRCVYASKRIFTTDTSDEEESDVEQQQQQRHN